MITSLCERSSLYDETDILDGMCGPCGTLRRHVDMKKSKFYGEGSPKLNNK